MERISAILVVSCLYQAFAAALEGSEKLSSWWVFWLMLPIGIPLGLFYALPLILLAEKTQLNNRGKWSFFVAIGTLVAIVAAIFTAPNTEEAFWLAIRFGPPYLLLCYATALRTAS